jgi:hypothetical protein
MASGAPPFFYLFGLFFIAMGLYLVAGRFAVDALRRGKTYYGVTGQRIIILTDLFGAHVKSLNLRTLTDLSMDETANGQGNLTFGPTALPALMNWGTWWPGMPQPIRFEGVRDARQVFVLIQQAQGRAIAHASANQA